MRRFEEKFKEGEILRVAGRITAHRDMGKSHFVDLRDASDRIQIYLQEKEIGPKRWKFSSCSISAISSVSRASVF